MSVRENLRDDPTVRKILQILVIAITLAMALTGMFILFVIAEAEDLPQFAEIIIDRWLPFFRTPPGDILSIILGAAPAVVAGVCYTSYRAQRHLNTVGLVCAIIASIGFISSLLGLAALRSHHFIVSNIGGESALHNLVASAEVATRSCLFYLSIFFGIGGGK